MIDEWWLMIEKGKISTSSNHYIFKSSILNPKSSFKFSNNIERKRKQQLKKLRYSKKEVFQPHLPVRLPCYDLAPVTSFTLDGSLRLPASGPPGFHGLTGGVYKVRERIHRSIADLRLLAIPASCRRVAACNLNWERFFEIGILSPGSNPLYRPL